MLSCVEPIPLYFYGIIVNTLNTLKRNIKSIKPSGQPCDYFFYISKSGPFMKPLLTVSLKIMVPASVDVLLSSRIIITNLKIKSKKIFKKILATETVGF